MCGIIKSITKYGAVTEVSQSVVSSQVSHQVWHRHTSMVSLLSVVLSFRPLFTVLFLSYVCSKQSVFGVTQEWYRELSFSMLECGVHDRLDVHLSPV